MQFNQQPRVLNNLGHGEKNSPIDIHTLPGDGQTRKSFFPLAKCSSIYMTIGNSASHVLNRVRVQERIIL